MASLATHPPRDDDETSVLSDATGGAESEGGDSLDSQEEREREVVDRLYRPATTAQDSVFVPAVPAGQGPAASKKAAVDYAAYTKQQATAELAHATGDGQPAAQRESDVDDVTKARYRAAFQTATQKKQEQKSTASLGEIDFDAPTAATRNTQYQTRLYNHNPADERRQKTGKAERPVASDSVFPKNGNTQRRVKVDAAAAATEAVTTMHVTEEEDRRNREAQRSAKVKAHLAEERTKLEAALASTTDPDEKMCIEMSLYQLQLLQRGSTLSEEPPDENVDASPQEARNTKKASEEDDDDDDEAATVAAEQRAAAAKERVERVSSALQARADGRPYDPSVLRGVADLNEVAAPSSLQAQQAAFQAELDRSERYRRGIQAFEDLAESDELAAFMRKLLQRHRRAFDQTVGERRAGSYSHDAHEAFRAFATAMEPFVFSRIAAAVGPEVFEVEEFFERVFAAEEDPSSEATQQLLQSSPSAMSREAWEVLLSMINFQSFEALMDDFIAEADERLQRRRQEQKHQPQQLQQQVPDVASGTPPAPVVRSPPPAMTTPAVGPRASTPDAVDASGAAGLRRTGSADASGPAGVGGQPSFLASSLARPRVAPTAVAGPPGAVLGRRIAGSGPGLATVPGPGATSTAAPSGAPNGTGIPLRRNNLNGGRQGPSNPPPRSAF